MTEPPSISCGRCGTSKPVPGLPCPKCGALEQSTSVKLEGVLGFGHAGSLGIVAQHGNPSDSSYRLQVQTPSGTRSDARLVDGIVSVEVRGSSDVGRRGEPAALETFVQVLQGQGLEPTLLLGRDGHGEDALLSTMTRTYTVQVVTVPSAPTFWRGAAVDSAATRVPSDAAAGWVRDCIIAKAKNTSPAERPATLLALDACLAGVVGSQEVVSTYLAKHPSPRDEFNFAGTWVIGPTASTSTQLGPSTIAWQAAT
jgi:hypothetical protein